LSGEWKIIKDGRDVSSRMVATNSGYDSKQKCYWVTCLTKVGRLTLLVPCDSRDIYDRAFKARFKVVKTFDGQKTATEIRHYLPSLDEVVRAGREFLVKKGFEFEHQMEEISIEQIKLMLK